MSEIIRLLIINIIFITDSTIAFGVVECLEVKMINLSEFKPVCHQI